MLGPVVGHLQIGGLGDEDRASRNIMIYARTE
jgi:hypothetical protein